MFKLNLDWNVPSQGSHLKVWAGDEVKCWVYEGGMGCDPWATAVFISVTVFGVYEEGATSVRRRWNGWRPRGLGGQLAHLDTSCTSKQNPAMQPSPPPCTADKIQYRVLRFIQTPCSARMCVFNKAAEHTLHSQTSQSVQCFKPNHPDDEYKDDRIQCLANSIYTIICMCVIHTTQYIKPEYSALTEYFRMKYVMKISGKGHTLVLILQTLDTVRKRPWNVPCTMYNSNTYWAVILLHAETETLMWLICNESIAHHTVESLGSCVLFAEGVWVFVCAVGVWVEHWNFRVLSAAWIPHSGSCGAAGKIGEV